MARGRRAIPAAWVQVKVEGIPNRLLAASQRTAQAKFFDRVPVNPFFSEESRPDVFWAGSAHAYTSVTFHDGRALLRYYGYEEATKRVALKFKRVPWGGLGGEGRYTKVSEKGKDSRFNQFARARPKVHKS